jgi:hypothetical protein
VHRLVLDACERLKEDEHNSDEDDSIDDVEQFDEDGGMSIVELCAIRERSDVVERVVRRVVGVLDDV